MGFPARFPRDPAPPRAAGPFGAERLPSLLSWFLGPGCPLPPEAPGAKAPWGALPDGPREEGASRGAAGTAEGWPGLAGRPGPEAPIVEGVRRGGGRSRGTGRARRAAPPAVSGAKLGRPAALPAARHASRRARQALPAPPQAASPLPNALSSPRLRCAAPGRRVRLPAAPELRW